MDLIIEKGNTALKAVWVEGETLGKTFRYQGERYIDFISSLVNEGIPRVLTISSVKEVSVSDRNKLKEMCHELLVLDPTENIIQTKYSFPRYLSGDRVASLVAARHIFKGKPCSVIDFGNTLTIDFIDAEGNYEEGYVSLGCRTRFKALNRYSKALPLVDTPEEIPEESDTLKKTIQRGIIMGIKFEIEAHISEKPDNITIFTGGDAKFFVKMIKNSIFVVCNLVMIGLALITEEYVEEKGI